jgi:L-ascorbate metabolism protein UlaG (beta-lactamase superfamily)
MTSQNRLTATFIGGPTLHFCYAGLTFLTDPTFDPPGDYSGGGVVLRKLAGPSRTPETLAAVDIVLLSHDQHADNLDVAGRAYLATVPTTLSTPDAATRLEGIVGLLPWQCHSLGGAGAPPVVVTAVPARHGPKGCEPISGAVTGFVLKADGWPTVYISGDNASIDALSVVTRRFADIDLAVLFVGAANVGRFGAQNVTFGAHDAVDIAALLGGATVVPVHAEDWAHFTEPLAAFELAYAQAAPNAPLVRLPRGVTIEIGDPPGP